LLLLGIDFGLIGAATATRSGSPPSSIGPWATSSSRGARSGSFAVLLELAIAANTAVRHLDIR
jgi:hypothetical protein